MKTYTHNKTNVKRIRKESVSAIMGERILKIPKNCPFESQKYKNRVWRVEPQRILKIPNSSPLESQNTRTEYGGLNPRLTCVMG